QSEEPGRPEEPADREGGQRSPATRRRDDKDDASRDRYGDTPARRGEIDNGGDGGDRGGRRSAGGGRARLRRAPEKKRNRKRDEDGKSVPVVDRKAETVGGERRKEWGDTAGSDGRKETTRERHNGDRRDPDSDAVARRLD